MKMFKGKVRQKRPTGKIPYIVVKEIRKCANVWTIWLLSQGQILFLVRLKLIMNASIQISLCFQDYAKNIPSQPTLLTVALNISRLQQKHILNTQK